MSSCLWGVPSDLASIKVRESIIRHRIGVIKRASTMLTPAASALFSLAVERLSNNASNRVIG